MNIMTTAPKNCNNEVIAFGKVLASKFLTCEVSLTSLDEISPVEVVIKVAYWHFKQS